MRDFDDDQGEVINEANLMGVQRILVPGIDLETSVNSIDLCELYKGKIFAAVGIHPNSSSEIANTDLDSIELLAYNSNVVAIGEIGLDFYRDKASLNDQIHVLRRMLNLSKKTGKPVCIHNRNADAKIIEILDTWYADLVESKSNLAKHPGVFHSYNGSNIISEWALAHNFCLGIGGPITFPNSLVLQKKVLETDLKYLVIETDAPFLSPQVYRGKRNNPANVRYVCGKIAELKKVGLEEVVIRTYDNANSIFGWI